MTLNVIPLQDRILVKRLEAKEVAKSGIIIPDTAKEKPQEGEVMAAGAGKIEKGKRVPLDVKVGDRILVGKYTGNNITVEAGIPDSSGGRDLGKIGRDGQSSRRQEVVFLLGPSGSSEIFSHPGG